MKKHNTALLIVLITLLIFSMKYLGYGLGDMNDHIVFVYALADDSVFENDWFVQGAEGFNVRENFAYLFLGFSKIFGGNYELSALVLTYITLLIFSIGFYFTVKTITKNKEIALFATIFAASFNHPSIGANAFDMGSFILSSRIALAGIIWTLYFFFTKRYIVSFLLLGFVSLIHIAHSYIAYGVLMTIIILAKHTNQRYFSKKEIKEKGKILLKSLAFFVFFSIPLFTMVGSYFNSQSEGLQESIIQLYLFRAPHHFNPLTWGLKVWGIFIAQMAIVFLALSKAPVEKKARHQISIGILAVLLYFLIGFVFTLIIPSDFIVELNLFRGNEIFEIFILLIGTPLLYHFLKDTHSAKSKVLATIILAATTLALIVNLFAEVSLITRIKTPLTMLALALTFHYKRKYLIALLIILTILTILANPLIPRYSYGESTEQAYAYIRENTPKDSVFLTPPLINTFRSGTLRSTVVDFKAFPFGRKQALEWYDRILTVTKTDPSLITPSTKFKDITDRYYQLTTEDLQRIGDQYEIDYILTRGNHEIDYDLLFDNNDFRIYSYR